VFGSETGRSSVCPLAGKDRVHVRSSASDLGRERALRLSGAVAFKQLGRFHERQLRDVACPAGRPGSGRRGGRAVAGGVAGQWPEGWPGSQSRSQPACPGGRAVLAVAGQSVRVPLKRAIAPLKRDLGALLETHARKRARHRHTRTFAKNLLKLWPALWTFSELDGVEPTNNAAERGLRGAVIYRKLSLGSQSEGGEQMIERLLSVSQTCRLQRRSLFAYLAAVLTARARDDPVPLLV